MVNPKSPAVLTPISQQSTILVPWERNGEESSISSEEDCCDDEEEQLRVDIFLDRHSQSGFDFGDAYLNCGPPALKKHKNGITEGNNAEERQLSAIPSWSTSGRQEAGVEDVGMCERKIQLVVEAQGVITAGSFGSTFDGGGIHVRQIPPAAQPPEATTPAQVIIGKQTPICDHTYHPEDDTGSIGSTSSFFNRFSWEGCPGDYDPREEDYLEEPDPNIVILSVGCKAHGEASSSMRH